MASLLSSTKQRREMPDLMSWVQCFRMYTSILSEAHPHMRRGLWAYQTYCARGEKEWWDRLAGV